jgi:hypothetical protein
MARLEPGVPSETSDTLSSASDLRSVVLVEGDSDRGAVEALAERRGVDLAVEGVAVLSMAGSKNIRRFLDRYGPTGLDLRLAGLCDAAEEGDFRRGLERAGFGSDLTSDDMERLGFFVCEADLEEELIRALGPEAMERVIDELGQAGMWRTFRKQPEWRGRMIEDQLWRFLGTGSGRKIRSAPLMVRALDLGKVPRPLDRVLAHALATA